MAIKDQISAEQWQALFGGPLAAATYVSMASGGGLEFMREIFAATRMIADPSQKGSYGALTDELLDELKDLSREDADRLSPKFEGGNLDEARAKMKQLVQEAGAASTGLSGSEEYKRWLVAVARRAAETKSGGVLGIGSKSVIDEQEQAALQELGTVLGVQA